MRGRKKEALRSKRNRSRIGTGSFRCRMTECCVAGGGKKMQKNEYEEKCMRSGAIGSIWGLIVGDALGVPVEFCSREELKEQPVTAGNGAPAATGSSLPRSAAAPATAPQNTGSTSCFPSVSSDCLSCPNHTKKTGKGQGGFFVITLDASPAS